MDKQRRTVLKGTVAAGGVTLLSACATQAPTPQKAPEPESFKTRGGGKVRSKLHGNSLVPEYKVADGKLNPNPTQIVANLQCLGCWTLCGLRARVDYQANRVLRVTGNPYHPLSSENFFGFNQPIEKSEVMLAGESGYAMRSTACARGAALVEGLTSPYRLTQCLKRVGKRGEGKWKTISFEELVKEVVEGGDLFGEGHVDGLKAIRDVETPVDAENPDYGPKANQLLVTFAGPEGRQPLLKRFANGAFGTINFGSHGSYCGLSYRAGSGAVLNDLNNNAHGKPDWEHAEYILFMGTSPAQSGNPFKRQARQLAEGRVRDGFKYTVVAPRLELSTSVAVSDDEWVPVKPGGDLALALGMLRWIIENERYNEGYLTLPSEAAMKAAGGVSYANATHLFMVDVIQGDKKRLGELYGQALTEALLTGTAPNAEDKVTENYDIVKCAETGELKAAKDCAKATLYVDQRVTLKDGTVVRVKSAMTLLKESVQKKTINAYAKLSGVPADTIVRLAKEFTSHGTKASAITHGGTMHSTGFYTAWAILMLNVMIGNMNKKGGMSIGGGKFKDFGPGPRYNLAAFPNMVKPKGTNLARSKRFYEKSSEFKRLVAAGKNPYPARAAWYPFVGGQLSEMITSALQGYPYPLKAWISHMTNPVYGIPGMQHYVEQLKDPKKLPLIIAIDAYMNETTALADYIVPDVHAFESWGFSTPWAGVPSKTSTARWPAVASPNVKTSEGDTVGMEAFIIAVAKAMQLPGFGENAIQDKEKKGYALNRAQDFFLRAAANIAFDGKEPVQDASDKDITLTGVTRIMDDLKATLKPEEVLKVANVYAKGGRFAPKASAWDGDNLTGQWKACLQVWNPDVARARNYHDGKPYHGCPTYFEAQFADNVPVEKRYPKKAWPFELMSFKSNVMNSMTGHLLRLHNVKPEGIVAMNLKDAKKLGIKTGDTLLITTPGGKAKATVMAIDGVMSGTIAIEHGYGHTGLGASSYVIDGKAVEGNPALARGINLNDLGLVDRSKAITSPWVDWVCGSTVRQGLPAKVTKVS
ncbi:MAG: molybdopterin-dependent oxidoreductase [Sutterella sp.]|nr:molybdopterin-dependent oxidoreductase [Sutterella sp.]